MKKIKVGYISPVNPKKDRMAWSGTYYNTFHAIRDAGAEVEWVSYNTQSIIYKLATKCASFLYKIAKGKGSSTHSRVMSKVHSFFVNNQNLDKYDLLFIPGQIDIVAGLKARVPAIYYTDGTFNIMVDYYWFGYSKKAIDEGNKLERKAVKKSKFNFRSSHWAAESTVNDYGANSKQTYIFPFGADVPQDCLLAQIPDYKSRTLKLLFSGKEWDRKGERIAVAAAEYLNKAGINTELYIVGPTVKPEYIEGKDFVKFIGYLDKNSASEYEKYLSLYHECSAFILPTRAECAGLVFSEANAFGMPIFSSETGGVGDYVINGVNGYRLPLSATGEDFGKKIEEVYKEKAFDQLSNGAQETYKNSTSWNAWSKHFKEFIEENFEQNGE